MSYTNAYLYHNLLVNPTSFISYPVFEHQYNKRNSTSFKKVESSVEKFNYLGEVNNKSKSKIIKAINLLYDVSSVQSFVNPTTKKRNKFRLNFITLTLSAAQMQVSDKLIKKECLEWWLSLARRKFGLTHYVWKAERQKNGNLHFHITTNCFVEIMELRKSWNLAQQRIGFLDLFEDKFNHRNPNSTDIRIVRNTKDLGIYLGKYIAKELNKNDKIGGKVWDCSKSLKSVKSCSLELYGKIETEFTNIIYENKLKKIEREFIDIFVSEKKRVSEMIKGEIKRNYDEYLQEVRNYKRNSKSNKQVVEVNKQSEKKGIKEIDTNQKQRTQKNNRLPSKRQIELFVIGCRV